MPTIHCAVVLSDEYFIHQVLMLFLEQEEPTWDVQKVATFLEDVPIFGTLSPAQLLNLSRMLTIVRRSAGSVRGRGLWWARWCMTEPFGAQSALIVQTWCSMF